MECIIVNMTFLYPLPYTPLPLPKKENGHGIEW